MPVSALSGTRLRERRLALGLRQADLAQAAGISASYLNLIEHNRRPVADPLLERLAEGLGLPLDAVLGGGHAGAVLEELRAVAAEVSGVELERAEEFAGRFPGWAAAVTTLHQRAAGMARAIEALNDRMSHDPHLSASLHEVLSAVASVRSTAAILADTEDIEPEWRARFHQNLHYDSERLAAGAEALVGYLDAAGQADEQGIATPQEELEAWLAARDWDFGAEADLAGLASKAARLMARAWQDQVAFDQAALPDTVLVEALGKGLDPLQIAGQTGVNIMTVFRRIALRPGVDAGLVLCDASGTLTFRKPIAGFALPRFGAACPLWPLFDALGRQMAPVETVIETVGPRTRRFAVRAICQPNHPQGFRGPELRAAAMLILPARPDVRVREHVGSTCRVCQRSDCAARREPSILTA